MPGKRMFVHDYTRVGFYMITILTAGRRRLFGECEDNRVRLSEAGEIVSRRWLEIPAHRPAIETNTLVVMEQEYGSLILIRAEGFAPLYKPAGAYFDLCAQGRLLVLSPFAYTGRKQDLTRERCLQMNRWVGEMCAGNVRGNVRGNTVRGHSWPHEKGTST